MVRQPYRFPGDVGTGLPAVAGIASGMPQRARSVLAAVLVGGLLAALLAGCSSGADGKSSTSPSAAAPASTGPSSAPSAPTATDAPPPAPRPAPGPAGQRAFARHVMDLWGYALRTNDAAPLRELGGTKACGGCAALSTELARREKQGWVVDFAGLDVRSVAVAKPRGAERVARARVDIPASDSYNTDGSFRNTSPAHAGSTFVVRMRYADKRYRLVSFTVS